jgi:hypothetical protein
MQALSRWRRNWSAWLPSVRHAGFWRGAVGNRPVVAEAHDDSVPPFPWWWIPFVAAWILAGVTLLIFGVLHFTDVVHADPIYGVGWCVAGALCLWLGLRTSWSSYRYKRGKRLPDV